MEEKTQSFDIGYYLDILSRRRWYLIIPFCLVVIIGMSVAVKLPKLYTATTLILIQPQTVPTDFVRPVISSGIESRIASISQEITSRSNLENIISRFNMFSGPEHERMFMEDKIMNLRDRITVEVFTDRRRASAAEAFSISFKDRDPEIVATVTNYIGESFINENMRLREQEGLGTSGFIEDQLDNARLQLEGLEREIKSFREKNMGGLPEQLDANLRVLDRLQAQLNQKNENLREARRRLVALNDQIIETENLQHNPAYMLASPTAAANDPYTRLQNMRQELDEMNSRYTQAHPDVVRLKHMIAVLERQIKEGTAITPGEQTSTSITGMHPVLADRLISLRQQRDEAAFEIEKLENDIRALTSQTAYYQRLVDDTPKREQELISLNRDYANIQNSYNSLLEKKLQASLAVNLEITKKGEQFRILDRAQTPVRPSEPDMKKIFMMTIVAAIGLGGGIVFVLEYMDSSLKSVKDLEFELDIPVLASIPKIYKGNDRIFYWANQAMTTFSLLLAIALCAGFGLMVLKGVDPAMDMFRQLAG